MPQQQHKKKNNMPSGLLSRTNKNRNSMLISLTTLRLSNKLQFITQNSEKKSNNFIFRI